MVGVLEKFLHGVEGWYDQDKLYIQRLNFQIINLNCYWERVSGWMNKIHI